MVGLSLFGKIYFMESSWLTGHMVVCTPMVDIATWEVRRFLKSRGSSRLARAVAFLLFEWSENFTILRQPQDLDSQEEEASFRSFTSHLLFLSLPARSM